MIFKPYVSHEELPQELQECVYINSWQDMINTVGKIYGHCHVIYNGIINKDSIGIEMSPVPYKKSSVFIYSVILKNFGIVGFTDEPTIKEIE